jgi:hypothetical protein
MKTKKTFDWGIMSLLITFIIGLSSCNKTDSTKLVSAYKDTTKTIASNRAVDKLEGGCPFECYDTRCKAYQTGYCGTPTTTYITIVTNPNNPYDYVGNLHNQGVDAVFNSVNTTSTISYQSVVYITNSYLASKGYDTTQVNNGLTTAEQLGYFSILDTSYANNPSLLTSKLLNDGRISVSAKNYLDELTTLINNTLGTDNSGSPSTYSTFANAAVAIENQFANDNSLSSMDLEVLQQAFSVARYSAGYWGNYILAQNSWQAVDGSKSNGKITTNATLHISKAASAPPFNWGNVAKGDTFGLVGGAIGGAVAAGIVTGPAGVAVGAVAGGVGGAISGSVGVALYQLFTW